MIYDYRCTTCPETWERQSSIKERNTPCECPSCGESGKRMLSALPYFFKKTHPDVKQDMHELIAGEPASNITEL